MPRPYTTEEAIRKIRKVHGFKYTFPRFIFTRMEDKSIVTCRIHGDFEIQLEKLVMGKNCQKCGWSRGSQLIKTPLKDIIRKARSIHGNKYKYRHYIDTTKPNTKIDMYCRACCKTVSQFLSSHLAGKHHKGCVNNLKNKKVVKHNSMKVINDLKKRNQQMSKEWQYNDNWSEEDLLSGEYCGFVYLFQFEDSTSYIGSKQLYKRVKDYKKIKDTSVENGWRDYTSSSKIVNEKIAEGLEYTKTILWAFSSMSETLFVEAALIVSEGLKDGNLNLAVSLRGKLPTGKNAKRIKGIIQELQEILR